MKTRIVLAVLITASVLGPQCAWAVSPTSDELAEARSWAAARFEGIPPTAGRNEAPQAFFSFTYGGRPSAELLKTWKSSRESRPLDDCRTQHTLTWTDPQTGMVLRCVGVEYRDYPTVEWTLYFKNGGAKDSPILTDIQAIDVRLKRAPTRHPDSQGNPCWVDQKNLELCLHHFRGGECTAEAYQPFQTALYRGTDLRFTANGGRPTDKCLSYFNLEQPGGAGGLILVVGWPGQWAAQFTRQRGDLLRVRAGQELTHFKLLPGEEIRTPLIVLQFYKGDYLRSQNVWRRWMWTHNLPRPEGKLPPPLFVASSSYQFEIMYRADTKSQKFFIDRYLQEGLKLDYWWMDAGWYPCDPIGWPKTGTWEVDTRRFPNGLREVSDHAHAKGLKTILWFEPERVYRDTWLAKNHPEWILGATTGRPGGEVGGLLNLGNPEAWKWLVNHVDRVLVDQGIDLYRQDFNTEPLANWQANDAPDRQGITEIKHVVGYLAYWDELRRRHPHMLIDSCASGGRRNDLETLRRSVPLMRSDYLVPGVSQQCHSYGIAAWIPYYGTTTGIFNYNGLTGNALAYRMRSMMCPTIGGRFDMRRNDIDYAGLRRLVDQWRQMAPYYYGDYYPLTSYSLEDDVWMAWQFDRPDLGQGMLQVFRRAESPYETARFKLHGLDAAAIYTLTNLDLPEKTRATGRELMEKGLSVTFTDCPRSAVITYAKSP
jgi:alpha-galactosidase